MEFLSRLLIFAIVLTVAYSSVVNNQKNNENYERIFKHPAEQAMVLRLLNPSLLDPICNDSSCNSQCLTIKWLGGICFLGDCWCYR
ncbi:hypothetical protein NQ317_016386 [Molorchus minor]|uniref:Uncharacterized protein n=1 Tax=Molorchus minor TaxID=1323400 RepID=A0ABQ9JJ73_9CUCU|nr:hypothetical protein NQ317_016386 [Molorchus minor]